MYSCYKRPLACIHSITLRDIYTKRKTKQERECWVFFFFGGGGGVNSPLRQYFSLYPSVSCRRGKKREKIDERKKMSKKKQKQKHTRTYYKHKRSLLYSHRN